MMIFVIPQVRDCLEPIKVNCVEMMYSKFLLIPLLALLFSCQNNPVKPVSQPRLKVGNPAVAQLFVTAKDTALRLSRLADVPFTELNQPKETQVCVFVDPAKTFQTMVGIGGALTDASAEVFAKLPPAAQQDFLKAYFDKVKGIGYNFARTNIASCDFSSDSYGYVADNDSSLKTFNLAHDEKFKIPLIKRAIAAAGGTLPLFVSPWSPPARMKDNNYLIHGGKLLKSCYQIWANHYVKFIQSYEALGIPVWGLSVQNEPMAVQ